ncbi:MAG: hypothetical protein JNL48_08695 [Acidobacteria bacterium]|nr:hypothetical protein [Acidobacteriota bacterium]
MFEVSPETVDAWLNGLAWALGITALVWLVGSVVGAWHRRHYNLTRADRAGGTPVRPDFLDVNRNAREAAIARGKAYDRTLDAREAAAAPVTAVESLTFWSRLGALGAALLTLLVTVIGTITKVQALEASVQQVGTWDQFVQTIADHKVGAALAVAIIGTNVVVFVQSSRKHLQSR